MIVTKSAPLNRALQMVRTYLEECAGDPGDPYTTELTEVIRNCVECLSVDRQRHGEGSDAPVPQEELRHALGYVDERSTQAQFNDMTSALA